MVPALFLDTRTTKDACCAGSAAVGYSPRSVDLSACCSSSLHHLGFQMARKECEGTCLVPLEAPVGHSYPKFVGYTYLTDGLQACDRNSARR